MMTTESSETSRSPVAIVTDSVAQVPADLAEELRLQVVPSILYMEGVQYADGVDLQPGELYRRMRQENLVVRTSAPSVGHIHQVFQEMLRAGEQTILYISLSSRLSAVFSAAGAAAHLATQEFPGRRIVIYDSRIATIAEGFIVIEVARMAQSGASLDQLVAYAEVVRQRVGLVATLDTLKYLARGGRIGKATYMLGSMFQIKPVVSIGEDGLVEPVGRVRGEHKALSLMVDYVAERVGDAPGLRLGIMHADALQRAQALLEMCREQLDFTEHLVTDFTPVMGAHAGPGVVGIAYYHQAST